MAEGIRELYTDRAWDSGRHKVCSLERRVYALSCSPKRGRQKSWEITSKGKGLSFVLFFVLFLFEMGSYIAQDGLKLFFIIWVIMELTVILLAQAHVCSNYMHATLWPTTCRFYVLFFGECGGGAGKGQEQREGYGLWAPFPLSPALQASVVCPCSRGLVETGIQETWQSQKNGRWRNAVSVLSDKGLYISKVMFVDLEDKI